MAESQKPLIERIKEESNYLRGVIHEELAASEPNFRHDTAQLLKFHGAYEQDDRDIRLERRKAGQKPLYYLMVRSKVPGGRLTVEQYLAHEELASRYAKFGLRITTRQDFQLHGVFKSDVKAVIREINEKLGTTLGACGDNVRNVVTCPAPTTDRNQLKVYEYAKAISDEFLSKSRAYHEIWLNGEKVTEPETRAPEEVEPIYGRAYLPRKFKIAIAFPEDNCVDAYTNDIGIIPDVKDGLLLGFHILAGGGLGMSHGSKETFPRLADPFGYVEPENLLALVKAIVLVQRDFGDRTSRKHARMKYLIHDRGLAWFQSEVEKRFGANIAPPREIKWTGYETHLGWHEQGDGRLYFGCSVENGRIQDAGTYRLRSGLKAIITKFKTPVHLTPAQDLILCNIQKSDQEKISDLLSAFRIPNPETLSNIQIHSMACPALPTCGLAITEAERAFPALIDQLEAALKDLGLDHEAVTCRMTGCPNGCARPYSSEIGLVGRAVGTYNIYLGGNFEGTRLNELYLESVPLSEVAGKLTSVFRLFKEKREKSERFGDFCRRAGIASLREQFSPSSSV